MNPYSANQLDISVTTNRTPEHLSILYQAYFPERRKKKLLGLWKQRDINVVWEMYTPGNGPLSLVTVALKQYGMYVVFFYMG